MQQPRDWSSLLTFLSLVMGRGRGAHLLLICFATTSLHQICKGSNNRMEEGAHSSLTALGLGIREPTSNFRVLFGTGKGHKRVAQPPPLPPPPFRIRHCFKYVCFELTILCRFSQKSDKTRLKVCFLQFTYYKRALRPCMGRSPEND